MNLVDLFNQASTPNSGRATIMLALDGPIAEAADVRLQIEATLAAVLPGRGRWVVAGPSLITDTTRETA